MPWTGKDFSQKHNTSLTPSQADHAAKQANAIRDNLIASGKTEGDADRIAIATANKRVAECAGGVNCKCAVEPYEDSPTLGATATKEDSGTPVNSGGFETINSSVIAGEKKKKKVAESIDESAGVLGRNVKFNDEKYIIENAALFGPPMDKATGHYVSDRGRRYVRSFHKSVMENANTGALGWPFHPEQTPAGGYRMRPSNTYTHKIVPETAWIDESSGRPIVRAHVKFRGKEAYESAKEGADKLGFSIFCANANSTHDFKTGKEVFESIDSDEKRPMSVDLVEASGATGNIIESAAETSTQEKEVMTPEIQEAIDKATAQARKEVLEQVEPKIQAGQKAIDEAAAYRKEQLVNSRLAEKKLDAKYVTAAFRKSLLESADEKAIDAAIDDHKSVLAKLTNPVTESGGEGHIVITQKSIVEEVAEKGFMPVLEEAAGTANPRERNARLKELVVKKGLNRISKFSDQSKETNAMRKAISEQANSDPKFFRKLARACGVEECLEADGSFQQAIEETTGTPSSSTSYANINAAVLGSELILGYNIVGGPNEGFIGREITKPYPSRIYPERYAGFTAAGGITTVSEGALFPDASQSEKAVSDPTSRPSKKGVFASITREEVLLDKTGQVLERINRCGMDAKVQEEIDILTGVFDLNSTNSFIPLVSNSWTPTAQFTNTDGNVAISRNLINANALTNYANLWTAVQTLRGIRDENNRPIIDNSMQPHELVVGSTNRENALAIINAREFRSPASTATANSALTLVETANFGFQGSRVLYSVLLEGITGFTAGDWYMAGRGGFQKQYLRKELIPFEVVQVPQAEIQATIKDLIAGVKAEFWFWVVTRDQRYVVKNTVSA